MRARACLWVAKIPDDPSRIVLEPPARIEIATGAPTVLGRKDIPVKSVSRQHAEFCVDSVEGVTVAALSKGGVRVAARALHLLPGDAPAQVHDGDVVSFGTEVDYVLTVEHTRTGPGDRAPDEGSAAKRAKLCERDATTAAEDATIAAVAAREGADSRPAGANLVQFPGPGAPAVPCLGLGTLALGVTYPDPSRRPSRDDAVAIVREALDSGARFIDTADTYSSGPWDLHYVEEIVSEAVRAWVRDKGGDDGAPRPQDRGRPFGDVIVATKGGMRRINAASNGWRPGDSSPDGIAKCVEASRNALGLGPGEPIPLWQVHHADAYRDDAAVDAAGRALAALVAEGKVLHVGLCNATVEQIERMSRHVRVVAVQNAFSPWDRTCEKDLPVKHGRTCRKGVLPFCLKHGIAFMPHGFLGGVKARDGRADFERDKPAFVQIARARGVSPQAIALAWARQKWPNIVHIVGTRSRGRFAELARTIVSPSTDTAIILADSEMQALDSSK